MASLPTSGRILIQTTVGDIEVELWAKETPLACRNLLTLALEGYYDGVIFHRVVPNFLVQTGDRTGTGSGGESFYGEPFDDETHPRLRFTHRGLVAMANNGEKNTNTSQFFITLDKAEELQGKHTLFGRVVGDTIYNVMKIGDLELDEEERPVYPPKIRQIKILDDPFGDLMPRITAAEKRAQQQAREQAIREREEAARRKQAKKDSKLLSFGDEEDGNEDDVVVFKKQPMFRTDLVNSAATGKAAKAPKSESSKPKEAPTASHAAATGPIEKPEDAPQPKKPKRSEPKTESEKIQTDLERVEAEIRKMTRTRERHSDSESSEGRVSKKKKKDSKGPSLIELQNAKYERGKAAAMKRAGQRRDETDVLQALRNFRGKLQEVKPDSDEEMVQDDSEPKGGPGDGEEGIEVDDDVDWIKHRLHFANDNTEEINRAEHDYEVIDPRQRGAKAKKEEMEKKKPRQDGGRGYRAPPKGPRR
ncbi:cyclophilin-like protein [Serendipita vermifera]|nr:cyclophilin-like protein [Serendipita vermifera]